MPVLGSKSIPQDKVRHGSSIMKVARGPEPVRFRSAPVMAPFPAKLEVRVNLFTRNFLNSADRDTHTIICCSIFLRFFKETNFTGIG